MKILVFGATGNTGQNLVKFLQAKSHEIFATGRRPNPFGEEITYFKGDITQGNLFDQLQSLNPEVIINLAGVQPSILPFSEATDFEATMEAYIDINIKGVWRILEYARRTASVKKYIYTTSHRDIEGHWKSFTTLDPHLLPKVNYDGDHSMYAISKVSGMMIGDYYGNSFHFESFNLRLPMIFSVGHDPFYYVNGERRVMPFLRIIKDAKDGKAVEVLGRKKHEKGLRPLLEPIQHCRRNHQNGFNKQDI